MLNHENVRIHVNGRLQLITSIMSLLKQAYDIQNSYSSSLLMLSAKIKEVAQFCDTIKEPLLICSHTLSKKANHTLSTIDTPIIKSISHFLMQYKSFVETMFDAANGYLIRLNKIEHKFDQFEKSKKEIIDNLNKSCIKFDETGIFNVVEFAQMIKSFEVAKRNSDDVIV